MQLEAPSSAEKLLGSGSPKVRKIPHSTSLLKEDFGSQNPRCDFGSEKASEGCAETPREQL